MSEFPAHEPNCNAVAGPVVALEIAARPRDLGGFYVRRVLPSMGRRMVGPFIFFDHMGPHEFGPGEGIDVRPHPHIGLATITYLFDGAIMHRDSVGSEQVIVPGDVNWMIAGSGIAHSERTPPDVRARGGRLHGIQTWVALPVDREESAPGFEHHPKAAVPIVKRPGAEIHVIVGTGFGAKASVNVLSPTLYAHARLESGAVLDVDCEHHDRAAYVVDGAIECDGRPYVEGTMIVLTPGAEAKIAATAPTNLMVVGGAPLDGPREIWWNFVSSSKARMERAKDDWRARRFAAVPGDDVEFIPLPES
jgi:redox-sensitive bicupin YhaK (pirin superfamily)